MIDGKSDTWLNALENLEKSGTNEDELGTRAAQLVREKMQEEDGEAVRALLDWAASAHRRSTIVGYV